MIRVVLDTNVLVSGLITSAGAPAALIRRWMDGAFELVASGHLFEELHHVLERPKFRRCVTSADIGEYLLVLRTRAIVAEDPTEGAGISDDAEDDRVISLARREASVLVTGDDQMLGFRVPGLAILTPRAFLEALQG